MNLSDESSSLHTSQAKLFIFTAFCVGQAVQTNNGVIHPIALTWIGIAIVATLAAITGIRVRAFAPLERVSITNLLIGCVALQCGQSLLWALRWGPAGSEAWTSASLLLMGIGVGVVASWARFRSAGLLLTLAGFALAAIGVIHASPGIGIDVFYFQEESSAALLAGENPYGVRFRDIYYPETGFYGPDAMVNGWLTYSYPYPPLMLLLAAPAKLLLSDVRYAHLLAMLVSAGLIVAMQPGRMSMLLAAMLLSLPRNLLTLQVAWTEPMVLLCVALVAWAAMKRRSMLWLALGALLAIKQYSILFLPLLPMLFASRERRGIREMRQTCLLAGCFAAATMLPFLIWTPTAFVRSVALWQFNQPFFADALSYSTMVWRMAGIQLGAWPGFLAAGGAMVLAWRFLSRSTASYLAASTLVLLVFFAFNKQAFCNYYTLVAAIACWAGAIAPKRIAADNASAQPPIQVVAVRRAA